MLVWVEETAIMEAVRKEENHGSNHPRIRYREEITATPGSAAKLIREVRAKTRRRFTAEDKIRIVLEGFRKEIPVSDLCRREGISSALYYPWLKDFMEAGKARLKRDSLRDATGSEVKGLREENAGL
jgi:transposase